MEKTSEADMQRLYEYMDKMGITYTVDRNPSPEKIAEIKSKIEKQNALIQKMQNDYNKSRGL